MIKLSTLEQLEYFVHKSDLLLKFEENGVSDDFLNEMKKLGFCLSLADKISEKEKLRDIIDFAIQVKEALGTDVVCVDKKNIDVTNTKTMKFYYGCSRHVIKENVEWLIDDLRSLVLYDLSSMTYALDRSDDGWGLIYVQNKKNIDSDSICVLDFCKDVLHRKGFVLCSKETFSNKTTTYYTKRGGRIIVVGDCGRKKRFSLGKHVYYRLNIIIPVTKENFEQELDKFLSD